MKRVWTLSEGVLAKRLVVKFANGLFDISDAVDRIARQSLTEPGCFHAVAREMCKAFLAMRNIARLDGARRFKSA